MSIKGFFSASKTTKPPSIVPRCGLCGLHKQCKSPRMPVTGEGLRKILMVAEAPGEQEDEEGVQLVGKVGQHFRKILRKLDVDLDRDCWKTNAIICRPPDNDIKDQHVEACRPCLMKTIEELNPDVIVLLGGKAVQSLIGRIWRESPGGVSRWVGWRIPSRELNVWVCPTWHPSYLLRKANVVLDRQFEQQLEKALELRGKPWGDDGACEPIIERIYDSAEAAAAIREMSAVSQVVSFDYECDRLKPDHRDARIVCAAVSNGERTIAFPWAREAITAMATMLSGPVPKIGWNIKFEERWTRRVFGHGVNNWVWDGMQNTHILDNRKGITSLKFQMFVQLGVGEYDATVSPYLKASSGNEPNRIRQVEMSDLLLYNGMDAWGTIEVARIQKREISDE